MDLVTLDLLLRAQLLADLEGMVKDDELVDLLETLEPVL